MRFSRKMLALLFFIPMLAFALDIAVPIPHTADIQSRSDAAFTAAARWQNDNMQQIPHGTQITFVYSDGWTEKGTYIGNETNHRVELQPLTQKRPNSSNGNEWSDNCYYTDPVTFTTWHITIWYESDTGNVVDIEQYPNYYSIGGGMTCS